MPDWVWMVVGGYVMVGSLVALDEDGEPFHTALLLWPVVLWKRAREMLKR